MPEEVEARLAALGAHVPLLWLGRLLLPPRAARWLTRPGDPSPVTGRSTTPQDWALQVFQGLVVACGGRTDTNRARATLFDLAARVLPMAVRGPVARREVSDAAQRSLWVRRLLARCRPGECAAACLLALEACGALVETPAMLDEARFRLGPGAEATDAQAIGSLVADVVWHCHEDAGPLLREVAARAR
jgi:hypothetical protein